MSRGLTRQRLLLARFPMFGLISPVDPLTVCKKTSVDTVRKFPSSKACFLMPCSVVIQILARFLDVVDFQESFVCKRIVGKHFQILTAQFETL